MARASETIVSPSCLTDENIRPRHLPEAGRIAVMERLVDWFGTCALPPRDIEVVPPALSEELCVDQIATRPITLCNAGGRQLLDWDLSEVPAPPGLATAGPATAPAAIDALPDVLLLVAEPTPVDIRDLLLAYGDLGVIDASNAALFTPPLADLLPYDVVVTWSNEYYDDPVAMGDVLADYVDAGGKVVNLVGSFGTWGGQMAGRFMAEDYTAMDGAGLAITTGYLGVYDPEHPIMAGVTSVSDPVRVYSTTLTPGSSAIARWQPDMWGHELFVAAKDNQTVVSINGFVGSGHQWAGQMDDVLHNAILWLALDSPWLDESPRSGSAAPHTCQAVDVTFDSAGLAAGDYFAGLLVESDDADEPELTVPVSLTVHGPASIAGVTTTTFELLVTFDATAAGWPSLAYAWAFGDGATSNLEDPTHTYAAGGCYPVELVVSDGCGQDTWTGPVCVCAPPVDATFTWTPDNPVVGETVSFFGSVAGGDPPLTWTWDLDDGGTASGQNVDHIFAAPGTYNVTLTVSNACGQYIIQDDVLILGLPDIEVSVSSLSEELCPAATSIQVFQICNAGTAALDWNLSEPVVTYWLSEDPTSGSLQPAECADVAVTFDATQEPPGDYTADLLIASNDPDEPSITLPVSLTVLAPASITSVDYLVEGMQVTFDATAAGEPPLTYAWDFGDGGGSDLEDPAHTYAAPGCYTVFLHVINGCGDDWWWQTLCWCIPPEGADFTFTPADPEVGETVSFEGFVAGGDPPFTWSWTFGDGATGTGENLTHAYAAPGTYTVTLTVDNACGQAIVSHALTVAAPYRYVYLPVVFKGHAP